MRGSGPAGSEFLDEFYLLLDIIEAKLEEKQKNEVNPADLRVVAEYIDDLRPLSKMQIHKNRLIEFLRGLNKLVEEGKLDSISLNRLKREKLNPVLGYLRGFHDFHTGNSAIHGIALIGITIDVLLSLIGVAKHYLYIPIFMLIFLSLGIRKQLKLQRKGKILNL